MASFSIACISEAFAALAPFSGCVAISTVDARGAGGYGDYALCISPTDDSDAAFGRWDATRRAILSTWSFDEDARVFAAPKA